ncbi:phosphonate C-P lyase system protein PhnH [Paenibacillus sp. Marseille-Q4541]|uniref:phosphonate C-P lyase system protein PhnH n=1 Tax=Paenibacillus sp. Marseille-Q4541 TaxID=2831522 RepID=UPI001BA97962|nr:phosphonate C-P lyase system protein PhnH [Paenibacillus sp. Marseille-Q4541]
MMVNQVHVIQQTYRKVIDALSRPGSIQNLSDIATKVEKRSDCYPVTIALAHMLLDTEVTFHVCADEEEEVSLFLSQLTYAKRSDVSMADYIFVMQNASTESLLEAMRLAKNGDLQDPHESATFIIESTNLFGGEKRILKGPGIEDIASCEIQASGSWEDIRAERNAEFPLGIDMIFTDTTHLLMALPRTTRIEKEVQH